MESFFPAKSSAMHPMAKRSLTISFILEVLPPGPPAVTELYK
jgi:hypothetical protein